MAEQLNQPRIAQLAQTISASVARLQEILSAQNTPFPSFEEDNPLALPKQAAKVQDEILNATGELHDLLLDPLSSLLLQSGFSNMACIQAITRFKIANMIPAGGMVSYHNIAKQTCFSEPVLRRLLQYAMTLRIFQEPEPGMVAHTKSSKVLLDPQNNSWMSSGAEESWPAVVKMVDALEKWPKSEEPNTTGFALANNTAGSIYDIFASDPRRAQRFASGMAVSTSKYEFNAVHAVDNYDWGSLGDATVVDVGGSQGHVSIELAKRYSNLNFVVQDMETVVNGAKVHDELAGRLRFEVHNFFQPQTATADVFFFRWILHNWSDKYSVRILRALIPALKPASRVVIMDTCMEERGVLPLWKEKIARMTDMTMAALLNARERTYGEWVSLLAEADPRFHLKEIIKPEDSTLALIDVRWDINGN